MKMRVLSLVAFAGIGAVGSLACSGRTIDRSQGGEVGSGTGGSDSAGPGGPGGFSGSGTGGSSIGNGGSGNGGSGNGGSTTGNGGYAGAAGNGGGFAGGGPGAPYRDSGRGPLPPLSGDYSTMACPGVTATMMPTGLACDEICGAAHCVPANSPGADNPNVPLCDNDGTGAKGKCVPDVIFEVNGQWVPKTCLADITGGASNLEGACIPYCFVSAYVQYLSQKGCAAGELCTPCIDQSTMMPGGACDNHCPNLVVEDSGPPEASTTDGSSEPADSGNSDDGG